MQTPNPTHKEPKIHRAETPQPRPRVETTPSVRIQLQAFDFRKREAEKTSPEDAVVKVHLCTRYLIALQALPGNPWLATVLNEGFRCLDEHADKNYPDLSLSDQEYLRKQLFNAAWEAVLDEIRSRPPAPIAMGPKERKLVEERMTAVMCGSAALSAGYYQQGQMVFVEERPRPIPVELLFWEKLIRAIAAMTRACVLLSTPCVEL